MSDLTKVTKELQALGGHPRFYELLVDIAKIHAKKNHDYAQDANPLSNLKRSEAFDIPPYKGALLRMSDKWSRIEELSKKSPAVVGESIKDSLIDNAVYSLLAILLLEEEEQNTKKK